MLRRVISTLSIICLFASPAMGGWSFVTLSDTYSGLEWGMGLRVSQLYTHHDDISFLISTGDFENHQTIDVQFQSRLLPYYPGLANVPWFEAFGNHNVDAPSDPDDLLNVLTPARIQSQLPGMSNFRMGPSDASMTYAKEGSTYSFDYGDAHIVVINQFYATDTGLDGAHENGGATACVYDQWYDWLVQDLEQNAQPLVFVFGHEPAFPRGQRHCGDSLDEGDCAGNYIAWDNPARPLRDKFWALLNSQNVVAHFVGHEHAASARAIRDLDDFPGIHRSGPNDYYCDEPNWNCYCINEEDLPEIANDDVVTPAQGVIEYNNGISRDNGDYHVIEVDGGTIRFHMYKDIEGTLNLVRTFSYDASSLMAAEDVTFVDNRLSADCLSTYSPATRSCGPGKDDAYHSIANALLNAAPGQTLSIRAGTYNEVIRPQISGTPGAPITLKNHSDEVVTLTNAPYLDATAWGDYDGYRWGIYAWNVEYITIEGIVFDNPGNGWGRFVNSNHIIVKDCEFSNAHTGGDVAGLKFVNSDYNQVLGNTIDNGFDNISLINSDYNLVQGNTVTRAEHTLWAIKCGDYNIIRRNYFYNEEQKIGEIYDCSDPANGDMNHFNIRHVNATLHNIVEDNTFAGTAVDNGGGPFNGLQLAGQHTIIRRNIIYKSEGTGIGLQRYSPEAEYNLHNRIFNNVFYDNAGGAIVTGRSSDGGHFSDNVIKNNIMMNNRVLPLGWADNLDSGHQISHRDMANFVMDRNCIYTDTLPPGNSIYVGYDTRVDLPGAQSAYPSLYMDNLALNPTFEAPASEIFRLQAGSQMIDAGKFLTVAVGAGSNDNQLVVADATYFSDGFGIQAGDRIQFESQSTRVEVTDINYTTQTLTLKSAMSWNSGDGVSLQYAGTQPDIGAFEFGSTPTDNQAPSMPTGASAAPSSATEMALTWTASTDNVGVDFYNIYRCAGDCTPTAVIGTTAQTTYTDANMSPSTQYSYQLSAVDASGNVSDRTLTFTATTHAPDNPDSDSDAGGSGGCFIHSMVHKKSKPTDVYSVTLE